MLEDVLGCDPKDVNNNKAFLGEQISCTNNPVHPGRRQARFPRSQGHGPRAEPNGPKGRSIC